MVTKVVSPTAVATGVRHVEGRPAAASTAAQQVVRFEALMTNAAVYESLPLPQRSETESLFRAGYLRV